MIYNGDEVVNGRRARRSVSVVTTTQHTAADEKPDEELPDWQEPEHIRISAFVEYDSEFGNASVVGGTPTRRERLGTVELPLKRLPDLLHEDRRIAYVSSGEVLRIPTPIEEKTGVAPPPPNELEPLRAPNRDSVVIGIIDVGGFDFAHPDFLHRGKTRFHSIWDQGLERDPADSTVDYGRVLTCDLMNAAIEQSPKYKLPATELLRQSTQLPGSHATHVASVAGGNSGVCPTALLAGVSVALPNDEVEGRSTFFDSVRLAHAVDYLLQLADDLDRPIVINISLGTNGHAHDGSSPINRWIDSTLDQPGRSVVVAAGNAGQHAPTGEGDLGHLSGRIHSSGTIGASGLEVDLEWEVLGDGMQDHSENEMEVWYEPQDRFAVSVRPPGSNEWIGPVDPGEFIQNKLLDNGTLVSMYNERYQPANGANRISVFLSPRLRKPLVGVKSGVWTVRLTGEDVRDGRFHAWIERDDLQQIPGVGGGLWRLPSVFTPESNDDRYSVNSLACGTRILAVANLDEDGEHIHVTSSQGPTRDERLKPEIAAPGTRVSAANGFSYPDRPWIAKTGTSMASPHVAGVVAWMLARNRHLTATQVIGIMRRTSQPLVGSSYRWEDGAGFGRVRPTECLEEVSRAFLERDKDDLDEQEQRRQQKQDDGAKKGKSVR